MFDFFLLDGKFPLKKKTWNVWAEIMPQRLGWGGHACMDDSLHLNQNNLHIFFSAKNHSKYTFLHSLIPNVGNLNEI